MARPGGDELPFVYSGTLVGQGQGIAQVQAVGVQTEMGKIGKALQKVKPEQTPLQQEMTRLVSRLFGIALLLCVAIALVIFVVALYRRQGELDARALTFTTLILANLGLILSESSSSRLSLKIRKSPNNALWWVIGGGLAFLALVLYVPFLRQLFSFSFLHPIDLAICLGGGAIALLWFEQLKFLNRPQRIIQSKSRKPIPENL
ncbi:putative cation-transporting ATPase [Trichormus variabilis NIES-23]|uniref:Putative cation-transporting ATPase n=1 Tax=Trichormus variabilis NIES-23 TaxID=1973479 RepID=A0A1Z4KTY8_ANAVA|nr:all1515 [Nostoc sp. PCC 7120 = FACHB-418]BAY72490.1 putative cation-transporting ATPase [Trichormus variabilis NIES-23]